MRGGCASAWGPAACTACVVGELARAARGVACFHEACRTLAFIGTRVGMQPHKAIRGAARVRAGGRGYDGAVWMLAYTGGIGGCLLSLVHAHGTVSTLSRDPSGNSTSL